MEIRRSSSGDGQDKEKSGTYKWKPNFEMIRVCIYYATATSRLGLGQRAYGTETDSEESSEDSMAEHEFDP